MTDVEPEDKFGQVLPMLCDLVGEVTDLRVNPSPINSTLTTDYFTLCLSYKQNGDQRKQTFHVKRFLDLPKVHGKVLKFFYPKSNAPLEHEVLERYREAGSPVPQPHSRGGNLLITEEVEGVSLESSLEGSVNNESRRVSLVTNASNGLCDLHQTGRKIQFNFLQNPEVAKTADLLEISELYCGVFCAEDDELRAMATMGNGSADGTLREVKKRKKEVFNIFNNFFGIIDEHFSSQDCQLIHGDITTYHIVQDKREGIWFIDFGRPKVANPAFDLAPLYFSQDADIPLAAIEDIYRGYIDRERRNLLQAEPGQSIPEPSEEMVDVKLKSLYLAGSFMDIRRASRTRFLKIVHPGEYQGFIDSHPSYGDSSMYYRNSILEVSERLLKEQERFGITDEQKGYIQAFGALVDKLKSGVQDCPPRRNFRGHPSRHSAKGQEVYRPDHSLGERKETA